MTKTRVENGESVRTPLKPYNVQDLNSFVAKLISRPTILEHLLKGMGCSGKEHMEDIKDGSVLADIKTVDGQKFMDCSSGELRLAWALSVDWFNPHLNKAAGKTASCGAVTLACLNLPPELRNKPENLFLAAIIPGPREPIGENVNGYLKPIVDAFLVSYLRWTKYTETPLHANGIVSRSVIAVLIGDLPASRKVAGFASHSHNVHCVTHVGHSRNTINDIEYEGWVPRSAEELRGAANAWRGAGYIN